MPSTSNGAEIVIGAPNLSRTADGRSRVAADVNGNEAWLATDLPLAANGDAWATMMFLPAAKSDARLRIAADLDRRLAENFGRVREIARQHWGYTGGEVVPDRFVERKANGGDALFFTCGIDSFYALRRCKDVVDRLVFVRGLNANLTDPADEARWRRARDGIADVAQALGKRAVFVETNLRVHPTLSLVGWRTTHISALAGVAHALAPTVARMHMATAEQRLPYGSDPSLDPLWSSGALELVGEGWEANRLDKVRAIADWPLVHRNLSVCYLSRGDTLNCGVCPKCVSTQLRFELVGALDRIETFPKVPLRELIDAIPWLRDDPASMWKNLLPQVKDPAIRDAIIRLLERGPSLAERFQRSALSMRNSGPGRAMRKFAKRYLF